MTTVTDKELHQHADRARGRVVVITGGANGIGRETVLTFARYGAKVVIGDLDLKGAKAVVAEVNSHGGDAVCMACNVLKWDDLVDLFELAMKKYGAVDVVIPNAGVNEIGNPFTGKVEVSDGRILPPQMPTLDVNVTAVIHTSWNEFPIAPQYGASKHAVLGLMLSLCPTLDADNIRVGSVHPWYVAGVPLTPVSRVAGAVFCSATDPDPSTSGCPWLLLDERPVLRVNRDDLRLGLYDLLKDRIERPTGFSERARRTVLLFTHLWRIFRPAIVVVSLVGVASLAWFSGV
ncbi:hypothetical protein EWM64_g653 [Hericium alpestre]|uniref:Uncharacterized protein n=1 Tax=Hericium alpestre TaxID=135208 RepID=A0A4Z0ACG1_9AGAM|nr:hypothetical protein EWM64_g653 [Hericium alpestre]